MRIESAVIRNEKGAPPESEPYSNDCGVDLRKMPALQPAFAQQSDIKRIDLQRHDLSVPGREVVQVLVEFAPGVAFPRYAHPGEEIVYVVEGALEYSLDGKPPVTLKAGEVLFIPAGGVHAVRNVGSGKAAELATYIVEKERPLLTVVE